MNKKTKNRFISKNKSQVNTVNTYPFSILDLGGIGIAEADFDDNA